jgi:hypothetical protein
MALIGLWHGANWTFLVFGLYWGAVIALYLALQDRAATAEPAPLTERFVAVPAALRSSASIVVMFALVCIGWTLFRAESLGDAWYVLTHAFTAADGRAAVPPELVDTAILWSLIAGLCAAEWVYRHSDDVRRRVEGASWPAIAGRYALVAAIVVSTGASQLGAARPFIYFQF